DKHWIERIRGRDLNHITWATGVLRSAAGVTRTGALNTLNTDDGIQAGRIVLNRLYDRIQPISGPLAIVKARARAAVAGDGISGRLTHGVLQRHFGVEQKAEV